MPGWIRRSLIGIKKYGTLVEAWKQASRLAPFELKSMVDPEEISLAVEDRLGHLGHAIDTIRNVAILVPIVLTWLSLSAASDAYQQSVAKDKTLAATPFIQLWQTGFPLVHTVTVGPWHFVIVREATHWFTFANFAFLDALVLGILLLLTLLGQLSSIWAYWRGKALYTWMNDELLALSLHSGMLALPGDVSKNPEYRRLYELLQTIDTVMKQVEATIKNQDVTVQGFAKDVNTVHQAAGKLGDAAQQVKDSFNPFQTIVSAMERHGQDLSQEWDIIVRLLGVVAGNNDPTVIALLKQYLANHQVPYGPPAGVAPIKKPNVFQRLRAIFKRP